MKIFISHATEDRELARALVELLQLGAGVSHTDIFRSSSSDGIPNGVFFVDHILKELQAADLIISILSRAYFASQFCLAEVGAAQTRRVAGTVKFHSLIVPPVTYADLGGVLYGVQSGTILAPSELSKLRDVVIAGVSDHPSTSTWDEKREYFLRAAKEIVDRHDALSLSHQITVDDMILEAAPMATYKLKLRIVLKNNTKKSIEIHAATWDPKGDGVALYEPLPFLPWQVRTDRGWEPTPDGAIALTVPAGQAIRTWIGLAESVTAVETLRRSAARRLGTLVLPVRIGITDMLCELRL